MELVTKSYAGTLESSDVMVKIEPNEGKRIEIMLESTVKKIYGDSIVETVKSVLKSLDVKDAKVMVEDKGALDFIIKSRVEAAVCRAANIKKFSWEA